MVAKLATNHSSFPGIPATSIAGTIIIVIVIIIIIIIIIMINMGAYCSPEPVDADLHSALIVSGTSYKPQFPIRAVPKMNSVNTLFIHTRYKTDKRHLILG